ncbi:hypothetical protein M9H77_12377 [Catharanthus roseus]|uniref:Uncharacterized protein n=1 Tax=Catharanthus roseus TaxID=4058 RepID=A0ACC0BHE1_CATRO|nr:hypothetical protein M9H77_12377 [Catharanthus roseus]
MIFSTLEHILTHISLSTIIITIHLITFFFVDEIDYWLRVRFISTITSLSAIFIQGFATSGLLIQIHQSSILVPALQSEWFIIHVTTMIVGYASLLCGSLLSVVLVVITFRKNRKSQLIQQLDYWSYRVFFRDQYGLTKYGDRIRTGIQRKLGHLLLGSYSQLFTYSNKYKPARCKFSNCGIYSLSYNLDILFWG